MQQQKKGDEEEEDKEKKMLQRPEQNEWRQKLWKSQIFATQPSIVSVPKWPPLLLTNRTWKNNSAN